MKKAVSSEVLVKRLLSDSEYLEFEKHARSIEKDRSGYYAKTTIINAGAYGIPPAEFAGLELNVGKSAVRFHVTRTSGQFYYSYKSPTYGWRYMLVPEAKSLAEAVAAVVSDADTIDKSGRRMDCGQQRWITKAAANATGRGNVNGGWMFSGQM